MTKIAQWIRDFGAIATTVGLVLTAVLSPLLLDSLAVPYGLLVAAFIVALAALITWKVPPRFQKRRGLVKVGLFLLIVAVIALGGYISWWVSQPHFEITAFDTLESDSNAYELTDMLMWNKDDLSKYGVGITFTLQIRPNYSGKQKFGKVVALISGDSNMPPIEKPLWDDFTSQSSTKQIQLTLPELINASGLKYNSDPPNNPLGSNDVPFQQAKLPIQIVREDDKSHPLDAASIAIRNAPWDMRSILEWRNGHHEIDTYVKNLGGTGKFTVRYNLVRLDQEIGSSSAPINSGTTSIGNWNKPSQLITLKSGEFFTDTFRLPDTLPQGRYLIEAYAVKKQNYVQFTNAITTWEDLNSQNAPWWFGHSPTDVHIFVVNTPEFAVDPAIQTEWERILNQQGVDLGFPISASETITSVRNTVGHRQEFQKGEIFSYDGQTYALYGPILEHYKEAGGASKVGFPTSPIQQVTSSSGTSGTMMTFEGRAPNDFRIYSSTKGTAAVTGWFHLLYTTEQGSHEGWLGFPLADEQYFDDSTSQMFEYGYFVYYYPYVGNERDWGRKPVVYPYLASRGTLFDVDAHKKWQDTGIKVKAGDKITIVQVGGSWNTDPKDALFDANGEPNGSLKEDAPLTSVVPGTLIGRIGENGDLFRVGRWRELISPADGMLYLAMNSNSYEDNSGLVTVQIIVNH